MEIYSGEGLADEQNFGGRGKGTRESARCLK